MRLFDAFSLACSSGFIAHAASRNVAIAALCGVALSAVCACSHQDAKRPAAGTDPDAGVDASAPFEALGPEVYGTKIKTAMTGRGLSDEELSALTTDPSALQGLVDGWSEDPAFRARLLGFFQQAFQQTQVSAADYDDQFGLKFGKVIGTTKALPAM
jgi:hypothetical protein